jgi:hypothetical protein
MYRTFEGGNGKMRKCFVTAFVLVLLVATTGLALEKTAMRATDLEQPNQWNAQTTCTVRYYNTCTGWVWIFTGWSPNDVVGTCYNTCCQPGQSTVLQSTTVYQHEAYQAPAGYNFTGVIEVRPGCDFCVPALASLPLDWQPLGTGGWMTKVFDWNIPVPDQFLVTMQVGPGPGNPAGIVTDHPAAGPTGPQACGYCYPNPRTCTSFYFGPSTSPLCPGTSLTDGICCVEWYWYSTLLCEGVAVESDSWTNIKALYK